MKTRIAFCLLAVVAVLLCLRYWKHDIPDEGARTVLVLHPYSRLTEYKDVALPLYEKAFSGKNVKLKHIYSGVPDVDYWQAVTSLAHKLQEWQDKDSMPDLVILHGDEAVDRYYSSFVNKEWTKENQWKDIPVVFTGVVCLDTFIIDNKYKDCPRTGFRDSIDWNKNLRIAQELWPGVPVVMELDFYKRDSVYKRNIHRAILADTNCVDNSNFQLPYQGPDVKQYPEYKGKQIVNIVSLRERYTNIPDVTLSGSKFISQEQRKSADSMMYVMLHDAKYIRPIQAKLDLNSNCLIDHTQMPQLSCTNVQFGDKKVTRILGGHFVSLETQINNAADYALQILDGKDIRQLPIKTNKAETYMDWKAMKMWGIEYKDWKDKAIITNVPMRVSSPPMWIMLQMLGILLIAAAISSVIALALNLLRNSRFMRSLRTLQEQMEWILKGNNCAIWRITQKDVVHEAGIHFVKEAKSMTHNQFTSFFNEEDLPLLKRMLNMNEAEGHHSVRVRLRKGKADLWLELMYNIDSNVEREHELQVMAINIDKQKREEDDILHALQKAEETNLKQSFLANLTHDLRSPMASIVSMATMLADDGNMMTEDERRQFATLIEQNSDILLKLLDDVSQISRLQMGEYRFQRNDVKVSQMMESIYQAFQLLVPEHIAFKMEHAEDCTINVDQARVTQVLNNLLSNAIKATTEGSITLGWTTRKDEIGLFVKDTGCGIEQDTIPKLFDKYYKADGKTDGAGLGLSICKTIVEKQDGHIEVESRPGYGSTFTAFFRKVATMTFVAASLLTASCQKEELKRKKDGTAFNVTVIHSFDSLQYAYKEFDEALAQKLEQNRLDINFKHVYLDNDDYNYHHNADEMVEQVLKDKDCDIILCEGDAALNRIMERSSADIPDSVRKISLPMPVVAGNICAPFWDEVSRFSNLRIWTSGTDPRTILPFIGHVTGANVVEVEIDFDKYNMAVRKELSQFLKGVPYMDQLNMSDMRTLMPPYQRTIFADSMIVLGISAANNEMNGVNDPGQVMEEFNGQYEEVTNILLNYSVNYPQLVVKKDVWARELASRTHRPQFTLISYDFGSTNTPYLAGYFPSMTTIANDMATTATHFLEGNLDEAKFSGRHQREMFLDYNALESYGLNYNDYKDQWVIVNTPFRLRNPLIFYGTPMLALLLISIVCYYLVVRYQNTRHAKVMKLQRSISEGRLALLSTDIFAMAADDKGNVRLAKLGSTKTTKIHGSLHKMVMPEKMALVNEFETNLKTPGFYNLELPLSFNNGKSYHWWRMTYQVVRNSTTDACEANGVLINIDSKVERNRNIQQTQKHIRQMENKEKFINNLNHEIRTPLNVILGFSEILASPEVATTPEEHEHIRQSIRFYSDRFLSQVQDILDYSRIESGRMRYHIQPIRIEELLLPILLEQKNIVEDPNPFQEEGTTPRPRLQMNIQQGREGMTVMADQVCVKRIIEQLVSNAVKFSHDGGEIRAGWMLDMQNGQVEVYVEDNGIGIDKDTKKLIFRDFYKKNKMGMGIGLGLSICRAMAMGMGGHMTVNSAPGKGTRASFFLKLEADPERA